MLVHHFTATHLVPKIQCEGLWRGGVLDIVHGSMLVRPGYIWLTVNSSFRDQDWAEGRSIPYDRAARRLDIKIPASREHWVLDWLEFCAKGGISQEAAELLNRHGDPENWRLFQGQIPAEWIVNIEEKGRLWLPS